MVPVKLRNAAIVVLAANNNPRLLNPDFLKRNKMVPEEWVVTDTLVTPPVAHVMFENELQIVVEEYRLHFQANRTEDFAWSEELPRIAEAYMKILPYVTYGDVGLNFVYTFDDSSGGEKVSIQSLIKSGPWLTFGSGITGVALEMQYRNGQPQMNIKMGSLGNAGPDGKKIEGLVFNVNFHHPFQAEQQDERFAYLRSMAARQVDFFHFLETLPFECVPIGQTASSSNDQKHIL